MGNVCGAFWPIAKRHMAQQPAVNVSIRPFKRLNAAGRPVLGSEVCFRISPTSPLHDLFDFYASTRDIPLALLRCRSLSDGELVRGDQTPADLGLEAGGQLDLVAELTRSPPPGGLLPELLQNILEFLPGVEEVHALKRTSFCWRAPGRSAIEHGRWKPIRFVVRRGKRSMLRETVPASELTACRAAWDLDPNETLRILFTWGIEPPLAARFLAIVEPSLDGLERILRLCEPAHRFAYAKNQLIRSWDGPERDLTRDTTWEVVRGWTRNIGTPIERGWDYWRERPANPHDLVVNCVSEALRSWTDAAVAADFFFWFFSMSYFLGPTPNLSDFTQGWDDGKASALAAALAADRAAVWLSPDIPGIEHIQLKFAEKVEQVEQFLRLKQRLVQKYGPMSRELEYVSLVEHACCFPGKFYWVFA